LWIITLDFDTTGQLLYHIFCICQILEKIWENNEAVHQLFIDFEKACSAYGERKGVYRVLVGKPEGKRPLGKPGVDGRIILRWKWDVGVWTGSS
jgi:hypothetical protein